MLKVIKDLFHDKKFLTMLLAIAIPVAFQNLLTNSVNMIDTLMVSRLTTASVSAVGLANKFFYAYFCLLYGVVTGSCIFIAQYYGADDKKGLQKVYSNTCIVTFIIGTIFFFFTFFFPSIVIKIFTNQEDVIKEGIIYIKNVSFIYLLIPLILTPMYTLMSMQIVKISVVISCISMVVNVVLNYLLIEGHCGFPMLGVQGAAIATVIARFVECIIYFIYVFVIKKCIYEKITDVFTFDTTLFKKMLPYTIPVVLNEVLWGVGVSLYFVAFGRLPAVSVAAVTVVNVIQDLVYIFFIGVGTASATIIGNTLGNNEFEKAKKYGQYMIVISCIVGLITCGLLALIKPWMFLLYGNLGEECLQILDKVYLITIICSFPRSIDFLLIIGIFRPGGDTKVALIIDIGTLWLGGVLFAFLSVFVWHLPTHLVVLVSNLDCFIKAIFCLIYFFQYKWIKNVI